MNMYLTEKDNDGWRKNKWEKNMMFLLTELEKLS